MTPWPYTNQQKLEMIVCYRESKCISSRAAKLFEKKFGIRVCAQTIQNADYVFREYGCFNSPIADSGRSRNLLKSCKIEEAVLEFFRSHPMASTTNCASALNVAQSLVYRILKEEGVCPYSFTKKKKLRPRDNSERVEFCRWLRKERPRILWTDESTFTHVGMFSMNNAHYWNKKQNKVMLPNSLKNGFSINVWAGILGDKLLGPVFLKKLNADTYLELLSTKLDDMLEDEPLSIIGELYFQHNGSPAHHAKKVREYLDKTFGDRWIGRAGPVAWPVQSPDISPLDFFLWSRIKKIVYGQTGEPITSVQELKERIKNAFSEVSSDKNAIIKTERDVLKQAYVCIESGGKYNFIKSK